MSYLAIAIFLLLLKLVMIGGLSCCILSRFSNLSLWFGILAGWLGVQALQLLGMVALSLLHALDTTTYAIWVGLQAMTLLVALVKTRAGIPRLLVSRLRDPALWPILVALLLVTGLLLLRGLFFFDVTYDSYSYALPRLGYFYQHHSIFACEPGVVSRIFCNEWNAELNAFHYALLTGNDRAFTLAGIEVWLVAFIAIVSLARALKASLPVALWIGLIVASTPEIFNLAGITKGDVLAMTAMVSALAGLLWMRSADRCFPFFIFTLLWLGYGAGCKGTLVPVFALFSVLAAIWILLGRRWSECFPSTVVLLLVLLCLMLFFSRHITNLIVFHNPLKRVAYEESFGFRWINVPEALYLQVRYTFGISPDRYWNDLHPAVSRDFAATGWLMFVSIIYWYDHRIRHRKALMTSFALSPVRNVAWLPLSFILGIILIWFYLSGLFPVISEPRYRTHVFRFFLPFIVPVAVYLLHGLARSQLARRQLLWASVLVGLVLVVNIVNAFKPSDILFIPTLRVVPQVVWDQGHFTLRQKSYTHVWPPSDMGELAKMKGHQQRILILTHNDFPIYQFFGQNMEWHVEFANSPAAMRNWLQRMSFDWVILSQDRDRTEIEHWDPAPEFFAGLQEEHFALQKIGRWAQVYKRQ